MSSDAVYRSVVAEVSGRNALLEPLLDLGCGKGDFLALLASRGLRDLTGADAHEYDGRANSFRFVKADLNSKLPFGDSSFATVTAVEVVEHLENPRAFLREAHRVLRPGGAIAVTTPNNESLTSLLSLAVRGRYSAFADRCYPAHITPLLEVDLRRIFAELGFADVKVGWSGVGRMPGVGLHWQRISFGALGGKRFSDNMLVTAVKSP